MLVAPVRIGKDATTGAGSTITKDAPDGQLTLARGKQADARRLEAAGEKAEVASARQRLAQCRPCIPSRSPRSRPFRASSKSTTRRFRANSCTGRRRPGTACRASRSPPSSRSATCATSRSRATRCASGARSTESSPLLPSIDSEAVAKERDYGARMPRRCSPSFARRARRRSRCCAGLDEAQLERPAVFEGYGPVTLRGLIHYLCSHDQQHLAGPAMVVRQDRCGAGAVMKAALSAACGGYSSGASARGARWCLGLGGLGPIRAGMTVEEVLRLADWPGSNGRSTPRTAGT